MPFMTLKPSKTVYISYSVYVYSLTSYNKLVTLVTPQLIHCKRSFEIVCFYGFASFINHLYIRHYINLHLCLKLLTYLLTYACYPSRRSTGLQPAFSIQPCPGQTFPLPSNNNKW